MAREHGLETARLRPGLIVEVHDLSSAGLTFASTHRALPGQLVVFHLADPSAPRLLRGRVVGCRVASLSANRISYVTAVAFEATQPWVDRLAAERCVHS